MGAETSILQGCDLEEPFQTSAQQEWKIHPAKRNDGSRVSVFIHKNTEQKADKRLENAAKQLKILRHPTILKFFDSCNNVEGTYLITELVKPLELVLETLTSEEICAGMYNIVEALSFLHQRGGVSHNNVCMSSIYVSQDGGWRLGGMEHLCKFNEATVQFLEQMSPLRDPKIIPPEEKDEKSKSTISPDFGHARDAYAFGVLAQELLEYLTELGDMTSDFANVIEYDFLNPDPQLRPKLKTLLSDKLFKNAFLEIVNFLNNITIKNEIEKTTFFKTLVPKLLTLPTDLIANRLVPKLLTRFVMAESSAVEYVYPHLLTPNMEPNEEVNFQENQIHPVLPIKEYKEQIIPILQKIFLVRETHVRLTLLKYFTLYVDLLDVNMLRKTIMPQLLLGLRDTNNDLVSASLHALGDLVPVLGGRVVVGGTRHKYFLDGRPKFQQQESPFKAGPHTFNLTAVSGVINLPKITRPARSHANKDISSGKKDLGISSQEERERRRLETKKRNEERKLEREKRKQEQQKKVTLATEVIHDVSLVDRLKDLEQSHSEDDTGIHAIKEDLTSDLTQNIDSDTRDIAMDSKFQEEESWSDWGDMEQPETVAVEMTSDEPTEKGKEDNWSSWDDTKTENVTETKVPAKGKSGALKLKIGTKGSKDSNTTPKSPTTPTGQSKSPRSPKSPSVKEATSPGGRNVTPKDLGEGYSIPEIKAKMPDSEPDFFADMEPTVKSNIVSLEELSSRSSKTKPKPAPKSQDNTVMSSHKEDSSQLSSTERAEIEAEIEAELSASFAAVETNDEEEGGWGDDDLNLELEDEDQSVSQ
ncbi:protein-associating with the carboxyl-terminal domain of ezrin-like [Glandiceps talaboti]